MSAMLAATLYADTHVALLSPRYPQKAYGPHLPCSPVPLVPPAGNGPHLP